MPSKNSTSYYRNFVFGVEDSLVSTVGLLSGISVAGASGKTVIATGMVLIFVEAISMGAGSFLSESSAEIYENHRDHVTRRSYIDALVMSVSYLISGLIPLFPYFFFSPYIAFWSSIGFTLLALVMLGVINAEVSGTSFGKNIIRMILVSGSAIIAGSFIGQLFG